MTKAFNSRLLVLCLLSAFGVFTFAACGGGAPSSKEPRKQAEPAAATKAQAAPVPEVEIRVDEAMLRKPHAILGGTIKNVGGERLENLVVEMELQRRDGGGFERREVALTPASLSPGEQGRYALKVLSGEWLGSRILRLRSTTREGDVAFKSLPGAKRPPERLPESRTITVTKEKRPRPKGEEFINTPDSAVAVP